MARQLPTVRYDKEADAIYVHLHDGRAVRTQFMDDLRMIDVDTDGTVVGIEFLDVSGGIDLHEVPFRQTVETLIEPFNFKVLVESP